jgi:hypothetical protein
VLPPPPVKRPLHARFFDTVPLAACTLPQFPVPTAVVKLRRVGFTPQHACTIVVVVVLDVVVVTVVVVVVVDCSVVDVVVVVVEVVAIVSVVTVVLLVVARVVLLLVGAVEVVSVVLVVVMVLVVVIVTPPGQVQSARQSSMAPPTEVGGHDGLPGGSHCSPGSMKELPHDDGRLVLDEDEDVVVTVTVVVVSVVPVVDVVVDVVTGAVVVVEPPTQSGPVQASQQLDCVPTQALPSGGAWHRDGSRFTLQRVRPNLSVRQHVTAPSFPQVDLAAHVRTRFLQPDARRPSRVALFTTFIVHETYCPWLLADAQSHCSSASARTAAIEALSQGPSWPCRPFALPLP